MVTKPPQPAQTSRFREADTAREMKRQAAEKEEKRKRFAAQMAGDWNAKIMQQTAPPADMAKSEASVEADSSIRHQRAEQENTPLPREEALK